MWQANTLDHLKNINIFTDVSKLKLRGYKRKETLK